MSEENFNEEELKIPAYQRKKKRGDYANLIDHFQIPQEDKFIESKHQNKKILVLNSGSSSIKAKLFEIEAKNPDNLNSLNEIKSFQLEEIEDHEQEIRKILNQLLEEEVIISYDEIIFVGHRVVHGSEKFKQATIIDESELEKLEKLSDLAPLHNPVNLQGIKICKKIFSESTRQVAVFDTAFHQTMPEKAYLYGLPEKFYHDYGIRRFGFHGTSHKYVINRALDFLKNSNFKENSNFENLKIISCHLGNGSSITASIDGKSVDTSMGFTPLEGVMMGTRSGTIDPAIPTYLIKNHHYSSNKVEEFLNEKSGLEGFSGISNSMKEIYETSKNLNKQKAERTRAQLTIEMLAYQIAKYCGGFAAAMNGLDCLIFTGGMGEKAFYLREKVCNYLQFLGLKFDQTRNLNSSAKHSSNSIKNLPILQQQKITNQNLNLQHPNISEISLPASPIKVLIIPTNEEKQIALECLEI